MATNARPVVDDKSVVHASSFRINTPHRSCQPILPMAATSNQIALHFVATVSHNHERW
jgi:hypothetical protein